MKRLHDKTYPAVPAAVMQARHAVRRVLDDQQLPNGLLERAALALTEAVTNCVVHAYDGRDDGTFRVTVDFRDDVAIAVSDEGPGLMPRLNSPGLGMGLPIIGQVSDGMTVSDGHGSGTLLMMTFAVRPEDAV